MEQEEYAVSDLRYVEESVKHLIEELKRKNIISQDFEFLTKPERERQMERFIDDFILNG